MRLKKETRNYIAEFMRDNDLEIGEEFEIDGVNERYHFSSDYRLCSSLEFEVPNKFQCLFAGVFKVKKLPKQEYVEVDNSVPRFTEIEARDKDEEEWQKMLFIVKDDCDDTCTYHATSVDKGYGWFKQARMLKPTEPEFKEGELIEVSDDKTNWYERKLIIKYKDMFICECHSINKRFIAWQYARPIKEQKS